MKRPARDSGLTAAGVSKDETITNGAHDHDHDDEHHHHDHEHDDANVPSMFQVTVKLPHKPHKMTVTVSTAEQVQDLRQSIVETPDTFQYTCFHLEHNGILPHPPRP